MKVLVVEDEKRLSEAIAQILKESKYLVDVVNAGDDGLYYAQNGEYDVIVLDVMLPKMDGFEVARKLREDKNSTPIIMLTAREEVPDRVRGLDSGADDYMTKPFSPQELLARIRALSRRQGEVIMDELRYGDLILNLSTNTLYCGTKSIRLGFKEYEIMRILMSSPSIITTKEDLINKVWGADSDAEDNNVEAYISFLRKKIGHLNSSCGIENIRKVGYRLEGSTQ